MRFVIMADGRETRWRGHLGTSKHLAPVNGEPIIARTVRLLREMAREPYEIIITSHNKAYEFEGSRRHEPVSNNYEIDRFTDELIIDDMCFLYGDTYYTEDSLKTIVEAEEGRTLFFGNSKSIVAIRISDGEEFRRHKDRVKDMFIRGELPSCKGWQVYQSFTGQDLCAPPKIGENFVMLKDKTTDINTPEDYDRLV